MYFYFFLAQAKDKGNLRASCTRIAMKHAKKLKAKRAVLQVDSLLFMFFL